MRAAACIIDIDGTVVTSTGPIPGAAGAIAALERAGIRYVFATNTTRHPRTVLAARLASAGIDVEPERIWTAPVAAARWLQARGVTRVSLLLPSASFEEFSGFEVDDERPEAVVVGDLGREWTFDRLNAAFLALRAGAVLVAIQKNRCWNDGTGLKLDAGPFVAALEYATGRTAELIGKPAAAFFETAISFLQAPRERIVVVGDSVENDVKGGHDAGCQAVAVRTGSFREDDLAALARPPEAILATIAALPDWLGI
ncbi:MAG: HAD-IIA family hydrolase [Acidobacteria bacterium]|nr:HAD-IIA family hydrolase [Acidobacteriota bacterium]